MGSIDSSKDNFKSQYFRAPRHARDRTIQLDAANFIDRGDAYFSLLKNLSHTSDALTHPVRGRGFLKPR